MTDSARGDVWINTDIWDDPRWIALPGGAQMLYMGILMYPRVNDDEVPPLASEITAWPPLFPGFGDRGGALLAALVAADFVAVDDTDGVTVTPWEYIRHSSPYADEVSN